jgi:hypothetical protein
MFFVFISRCYKPTSPEKLMTWLEQHKTTFLISSRMFNPLGIFRLRFLMLSMSHFSSPSLFKSLEYLVLLLSKKRRRTGKNVAVEVECEAKEFSSVKYSRRRLLNRP